jgi:hypothetical protein
LCCYDECCQKNFGEMHLALVGKTSSGFVLNINT